MCAVLWPSTSRFLSTPSARRATFYKDGEVSAEWISIHALREEGDRTKYRMWSTSLIFLSTPSARRATCQAGSLGRSAVYFYPRPPRGGRPVSDVELRRQNGFLSTPSARRATELCTTQAERLKFLSTPSARRATVFAGFNRSDLFNFYPRPPRGGRHSDSSARKRPCENFYPRPPRGGRLTMCGIR